MNTEVLLLNLVRKLEPTLTGCGMFSGEKYEADPIPLKEFIICMEWLKAQEVSKEINYQLTSYALKHYVEEWHRQTKGEFKYISNCALIAAIVALGITYRKIENDLNVLSTVFIRRNNDDESIW